MLSETHRDNSSSISRTPTHMLTNTYMEIGINGRIGRESYNTRMIQASNRQCVYLPDPQPR